MKMGDFKCLSSDEFKALLKKEAQLALRECESKWHKYASSLDVGIERTKAFNTFENIRTAQRR